MAAYKTKEKAWQEYLDMLDVWVHDETESNWTKCEEAFGVWFKI